MINDQKERCIGQIISINTKQCWVELNTSAENLIVNGFDGLHRFAQINSYVVIPFQEKLIVAEVMSLKENDEKDFLSDSDSFDNPEKISQKCKLEVELVGQIEESSDKENANKYEFKFGVSTFPPLYSKVLYIQEAELDAIFNISQNEKSVYFGDSVIFTDYQVNVDMQKFFGKHACVLGNTGSGKSCTVSSLLQSLFKSNIPPTSASFVIFDTNGEYLEAFKGLEKDGLPVVNYFSPEQDEETSEHGVNLKKFALPHWFLSLDEWALLLKASEKTQLPVLRTALGIVQLIDNDSEEVNSLKNQILAVSIKNILSLPEGSGGSKYQQICALLSLISTNDIGLQTIHQLKVKPDFGDLANQDKLLEYLENDKFQIEGKLKIPDFISGTSFEAQSFTEAIELAIKVEESYGNNSIRNFCASLNTRLDDTLRRSDFKFLFSSEDNESVENYFYSMLGINDNTKKPSISIIDLSSIQSDGADVVVSVISRIIFDALRFSQPRNEFPVNLIVEEAHRYIQEHPDNDYYQAQKVFERISKEGRKYGMSLLTSTQRPHELSKTVLSQCSNFVVHRIMNPEDLQYIRRVAPYVSQSILDQLPHIPRQHALIFGDAINIPMLVKVRNADPTPNSGDSDLAEHWYYDGQLPVKFSFPQPRPSPQPIKEEATTQDFSEITKSQSQTKMEPTEPEISPEDLPF